MVKYYAVKRIFIIAILAFFAVSGIALSQVDILSKEERMWLKSRNNIIVVYPEKNTPPFVYITNPDSKPSGLSIDYLDLISEKIGANVVYLPARSRAQILQDIQEGKGDVIARLDQSTPTYEQNLIVTESYASVPAVIVVRKDSDFKELTLTDLSGKRIGIVSNSAAARFIRENYPKIVLQQVTDDEISLQQLVLGEVDASVIDVASLSYFLSRQTLSSVKIAGHTGFYYQLAFGMKNDKTILQSILEKGFSQISENEKQVLSDKWIKPVSEGLKAKPRLFKDDQTLLIVGGIVFGAVIIALSLIIVTKRRYAISNSNFFKWKTQKVVTEKLDKLEEVSEALEKELEEVRELEKDLIDRAVEKDSPKVVFRDQTNTTSDLSKQAKSINTNEILKAQTAESVEKKIENLSEKINSTLKENKEIENKIEDTRPPIIGGPIK